MDDNKLSSYREMILEHLFTGEIMRYTWLTGIKQIEIVKPEVDNGGYDLILEVDDIIRHVQLKATFKSSKVARFNVHMGLANKPSGCMIVLVFDPKTLNIDNFLWFGGLPGKKLPDLSGLKVAKHTKGNAQGEKKERPMIRVIPRGQFEKVQGISGIFLKLFGNEHKTI